MAERRMIDVRTQQRDGAHIITPVGEIDLGSSPELRDALRTALGANPERLVVDLSETTYMDSSGVATLVEAMQIARKQRTRLVLCAMQTRVRAMFEIARLDLVFTVAPDTDAAIEA